MAKKAAKKAAKTSKPKTAEMLLVGSKTKDALRAKDCNVSSDALDALNQVVHWYVEQAAARAAANGRKTVRGYDFMA